MSGFIRLSDWLVDDGQLTTKQEIDVRLLRALDMSTIPSSDMPNRINVNTLLSADTGNEVAYTLAYTTNKAISGDDTGLLLAKTEAGSPGTSNFIDCQTNGTSVFRITDDGRFYATNSSYIQENLYIASKACVLGVISSFGQVSRGFYVQYNYTFLLGSAKVDGATSVAVRIGSDRSYTTEGAKLVEFMNSTVPVTYFDHRGFRGHPTQSGITASDNQSQGQCPLTAEVNEVSTVAHPNDVVTMPPAKAGIIVTIINNGANTLQIFPASGDDLGAGVNVSVTLASGANVTYVAYDDTNWEELIT